MMNKKRIIHCAAAILMAAASLSAQNKSAGINLSIWKGISTQPLDSTQTSYLNLGIFSTMNRLNGVGINALGSVARKDMNGIQLSGLSSLTGGSMRGMQLSGICNVNGNNMAGMSASGLINIAGSGARGMMLSGLSNITGDRTAGVVAGGLLNVAGESAAGVQLSGMANITGKNFAGVSFSGLLNVSGNDMRGLQMAGLINVAGAKLAGMQIGLFNYATQADGVQLGLVNYRQKEMKGIQLGLINACPTTEVDILMYGGNRIVLTFVCLVSLLGMLTSWNAAYMAASRMIVGLARAKYLPSRLAQVNDKTQSKILEETGGLGTPATRADIIEKLFSAFYIERRGKELVPMRKCWIVQHTAIVIKIHHQSGGNHHTVQPFHALFQCRGYSGAGIHQHGPF